VELLLLRHGESVNNTLPDEAHIPDPELTEVGRRQAELLAAAVAALAPAAVVSSPLLRALDTARPLVARCGAPWLVWADVAETHRAHPGDGQPLAALRERFPEARFEPRMRWPGHPGLESRAEAARRAERLLRRLLAEFPGDVRVAVVAHAGLNGYFLRACLGAPQDGSLQIAQHNACINRLAFEPDGRVRLISCNDSRHVV
jgi:broad specificity phosphatase PhoE